LTLRFTKKHLLSLAFIGLLLIGITALVLFLLVKPIETRIDTLESNIAMQEKFIEVLNQKKSAETTPVVSSTEIQKKVPVIPLVEQLILQIQEAELVSNSSISNMTFSESDFSPVVEENQQDTNEENETNEAEDTNDEENDADEQENTDNQPLIEGLKQVTVSLTVQSPGYFELERFLSMIENQTRITKVDSLNFTGKQEITTVTQDLEEPLIYAVTISSFYMPAFPELAPDAPKIEVPNPANKKNPLFVNTADKDDED